MIEHVLGVAVVATGIVSRTVGESTQIAMNWRRKSCVGVSKFRYATMFSSFATYTIYTVFGNPDPYIFTVGFLGVVGTGAVLVQMWLYRKAQT